MSSTQKTKAELRIQDHGWPRRDRSPEENGWGVQQECFHQTGATVTIEGNCLLLLLNTEGQEQLEDLI